MRKQCVSKCKGVTEGECIKPCSFVGNKYCRLSASLKMVPPKCDVVKRARMKRISITPEKVLPIVRSLGNETPSPEKIVPIKNETSRNSNIQKIIKMNMSKRKSMRKRESKRKRKSMSKRESMTKSEKKRKSESKYEIKSKRKKMNL